MFIGTWSEPLYTNLVVGDSEAFAAQRLLRCYNGGEGTAIPPQDHHSLLALSRRELRFAEAMLKEKQVQVTRTEVEGDGCSTLDGDGDNGGNSVDSSGHKSENDGDGVAMELEGPVVKAARSGM